MWVFRLWGALVFAVLGEGVTRSCHPERGRAPIRFLQDGKPESKDLGFVLQSQGAPPFAVLWRRVGSSLCGADALVRVLRNRSRFPFALPAGCPTFRRPLAKVGLLLRRYVAVALLCSSGGFT